MTQDQDTATKILDTALALAERRSWESLRLHEVAAEAGVSLEEVRRQFREKEDLVTAWFDRADLAMLREADAEGFAEQPPRVRLHRAIMAWLEALQPHRRVTRQMLQGQWVPGRVQVQIPATLRLGRTVQWVREAARLRDTGIRRLMAETALAGVFLTTLAHWLRDDSAGSGETRDLLDRLLEKGESLARRTPGFASRAERHPGPPLSPSSPPIVVQDTPG